MTVSQEKIKKNQIFTEQGAYDILIMMRIVKIAWQWSNLDTSYYDDTRSKKEFLYV